LAWKSCYLDKDREEWRQNWHIISRFMTTGKVPGDDTTGNALLPNDGGLSGMSSETPAFRSPLDVTGIPSRTGDLPKGKYSNALVGLVNPIPGEISPKKT
jgi:hypothetical protein